MTGYEKVVKELELIRDYDLMFRVPHDDVFKGYAEDALDLLKAQEPIEARLHLCESCKKQYPDCEATKEGIVFGNGIGNDNIIGCSAYDNRWMSQNEPRVLALDEIHSGMTV